MTKLGGTRKLGASRAKLTLKFGNIPLEGRLARLGQENASGLSQFSPAGNPIGYRKIDKVTGQEVPSDQILKGKTIGDTVVTFTEDELDAAYANRQAEVSKVRVEDIQDIPDMNIKSLYLFKPENAAFWGLIGGRMAENGKQLRFIYVEGRQERAAILQLRDNVPLIYVLYFPSEVAELGQFDAPVCKPELSAQVDALFTGLSATEVPEPEEKRNVVIDQLTEAKLTGQPIAIKPVAQSVVQKGKSVEELLAESIKLVSK